MSVQGSYEAAHLLADALDALVQALSLPDAVATEATRAANLVRVSLAPRLTSEARGAEIAAALCGALRVIGEGAEPRDAAEPFRAMAAASAVAVPATASPGLNRAQSFARALAACVEAAALGEAMLAECRTDHGDRNAASAARARIAASFDAAADRIAQEAGGDIYRVFAETARLATDHIVQVSVDLRPLIRVDSRQSIPATAMAWKLYGDAARADELAERNRVSEPLFMPLSLEALSPGR